MISYRNGKLFFDTQISPEAFVRARLAERMEDKGLLAEKQNGAWTFSPWKFSGSSEENGRVFLEGEGFEGKKLSVLLEEDELTKKTVVRSLMVSLIEEMIQQNVRYSSVFSEGVFVSSDFNAVIFVPEFFFKTAYSFLPPEQKVRSGLSYVNLNLRKVPRLRFTQSAFAYELLSGKLPFSAKTEEEILRDMRDSDFRCIKNSVYGLTPELSSYIDDALSQNPLDEKKLKKFSERKFPLDDFYSEAGLEKDGSLKDGKLKEVKRSSVLTAEQFEKQAERELKKKERSIKSKRFLSSHSSALGVSIAVASVVFFIGHTIVSASGRNPSTSGLTSFQTVEYYYSSINSLDTEGSQYSSEGKQMEERDKVLSNIYVTSKMGSVYDMKIETKDFASWLFYNRDTFNMFGLSQFTVDSKPASLYRKTGRRKDKIPPVVSENGVTLSEGDTRQYRVHYKLVNGAVSPEILVDECKDIVTVVYKKGRWIITGIDSERTETEVNRMQFISDYKTALEKGGDDIKETCAILSEKYDFMPFDEELSAALENIKASVSVNR